MIKIYILLIVLNVIHGQWNNFNFGNDLVISDTPINVYQVRLSALKRIDGYKPYVHCSHFIEKNGVNEIRCGKMNVIESELAKVENAILGNSSIAAIRSSTIYELIDIEAMPQDDDTDYDRFGILYVTVNAKFHINSKFSYNFDIFKIHKVTNEMSFNSSTNITPNMPDNSTFVSDGDNKLVYNKNYNSITFVLQWINDDSGIRDTKVGTLGLNDMIVGDIVSVALGTRRHVALTFVDQHSFIVITGEKYDATILPGKLYPNMSMVFEDELKTEIESRGVRINNPFKFYPIEINNTQLLSIVFASSWLYYNPISHTTTQNHFQWIKPPGLSEPADPNGSLNTRIVCLRENVIPGFHQIKEYLSNINEWNQDGVPQQPPLPFDDEEVDGRWFGDIWKIDKNHFFALRTKAGKLGVQIINI